MRIGLFGGTFDPIHIGHLILAQECWVKLVLDKVIFIPTFIGYDRVIEEGSHVHEVEGGKKKKETLSSHL